MRVDALDVVLDAEMAKALGVGIVGPDRAGLLRALPEYDAVSMHVPAIEATKGMCDAEFFSAMADGAYFVNTARGPVVDEAALAEAVSSGRIRAGIDVYNNQPSEKDVDWRPDIAGVDGVYCTHHCGASTDQAQNAVADEVVRMLGLYKGSGTIEHCVNGVA
jgi:D-3-phosphoglycerate dehydrogenase